MTRPIDRDDLVTTDVERAADVLRAGGLVAIPTETVYGLAADATSTAAVARIFEVKGRPADHPLIVHLASADEIDRWAASVPASARVLIDAAWPGPLTVILPRAVGVLDVVTGGLDTVGLRVPAHRMTLDLLDRVAVGLAAPSERLDAWIDRLPLAVGALVALCTLVLLAVP